MLTTYDEDDYVFGALGAGASGFLLKNVHTAELHRAIRAVAAGDAVLTPRVTRQVLERGVPRSLPARQRERNRLAPRGAVRRKGPRQSWAAQSDASARHARRRTAAPLRPPLGLFQPCSRG